MSRYRIGVDVGGTFTDFVLYDTATAETTTLKVPTTPDDPSIGIIEGIEKLGVPLAEVDGIAHGTTTATNALIERGGAKTAVLVTEGHRDTLEMRRCNREELYDAQWYPPAPLVPRRHRLELKERLFWDGEVAQPLDEEHLRDVIETLQAREIESVAICLMHSYQHPAHEQRVKELVQAALPDAFVTASHECSQEFREFERGSTVAANAFVGPKVRTYMRNLERGLGDAGLTADVAIMQSNGGVCSIDEAASLPVKLARSGPAGGAMALQTLSSLTGIGQLVGIDIGGTSADVSVIVDGTPRWTSPLTVEWGLPLLLPSVDVISIGAGGGSLAWIDEGGVLHMGPQSAGARPGPACYGKGGVRPTSTDAHVVLGRVAADRFLDGEMTIDAELAEEAIATYVAEPMGMSVEEAAAGMVRILDTTMLQAIRFVTVEKGYDPRTFALVGFGGGGPLHVVDLARELGMARAIVPAAPGVLSAWGMLTVDMVQDRSRTVLRRRKAVENDALSDTFAELKDSIAESFHRQGVEDAAITYEYFVDMQYYGQAYSMAVGLSDLTERLDGPGHDDIRVSEEGVLSVPLALDPDARPTVTDEVLAEATGHFHDEHAREYGHADPDQEVQFVHARVFGRASVAQLALEPGELVGPDPSAARVGARSMLFDGVRQNTAVYDRSRLRPGNEIVGPGVVEEASSATVLPPGSSATVDPFGNLLITTGV
ncbi:hydantoinase/oxoprolinase family protein [Rhabdothermincola salaria]|uniref:hydantoinase/oxoprolinase family protein n=1 Tax=Rhabdothermincola salaria TaxID=2903142 RepID=UPI001E2BDC92|nr:hydantoinase/oxoprolinase family protein [Rhabdothermincola salaria]MCD9622780.1 hydantoinase/oxoprolinase family protein [Rhabdothermincola salaria]